MMLVSSCGFVRKEKRISDQGVCDGLSIPVDEHADSLLIDGGPKTLVTGTALVMAYDNACLKKNPR